VCTNKRKRENKLCLKRKEKTRKSKEDKSFCLTNWKYGLPKLEKKFKKRGSRLWKCGVM
jgi:hypothetical protein